MNLFRIILAAFLLPLFLGAVEAPPEVDAALRARVQEFYQLQKDHKYREADEFVAADTKDYYFNSRKANLVSFRIVGIDFAPGFQRATVRLMASSPLPIPGAERNPIEAPVISEWKIDGGKWCWYVDQAKLLITPFGRANETGSGPSNPLAGQVSQSTAAVTASINTAVRADPSQVNIDADNPAPQIVKLKNTLPGPVTVLLVTLPKGLNVVIAKPNLGANESTDVTISLKPGEADFPRNILLRVAPFGQSITIPISYGPAKK